MSCRKASVAITGASGVRYGIRLVEALKSLGISLAGVILTREAAEIAELEEGISRDELVARLNSAARVYWEDDFRSPLASSSSQPDCMAVVPASMNVVGLIANGIESNLVSRAALSILRLGRRLVIAFREAPLAIPHLRNLTALAEAGAIVMPLAPGFYGRPKTIDDLVNFMVGKVLDTMGVENSFYSRWRGA